MSASTGAAASTTSYNTSATDGDELRLSMTIRLARTNRLAGAWWPRSSDLLTELPPLLRVVAKRIGSIRGVLLNRADWASTPLLSSPVGSSRLRIGWYGTQDAHTAILIGDNAKRIELLLIPLGTDPLEASAALRLAATTGNTLGAREVLEAAAEHPDELLDEDLLDDDLLDADLLHADLLEGTAASREAQEIA